MKLGDIIKSYRKEHNLTMLDFAKLSNLSKPYVSMLEANKNSRDGKPIKPSVETLRKVAIATNMSLNDLLRMLDGDQIIDLSPTADEDKKIMDGFKNLNDSNRETMSNFLNFLIHQQTAAL